MLYADHHATTPVFPEVVEAMAPWTAFAGNPSSVHAAGRAARQAVEAARADVARAIGGRPEEIVFTSGGTESDNLAVRGGALAARDRDQARTAVLFTAAEHPAVREAARALEASGFESVEIPVDGCGLPAPGAPDARLDGRAALLSAIFANNETGVVNRDLPRLAARARASGILVHTDAVQAVGKIPVDVKDLEVDLLSLTAHKFGGPKGAGALWVKAGTRLAPLAAGGGQEKGRRPGTENVAAIVGLGAAIGLAVSRREAEGARLAALRDRFERGLRAAVPGLRVNGTSPEGLLRLSTATSAVFPGVSGEILLAALDLEGIAASGGSACASGTSKPSSVLLAMGLSPEEARGTVRFSFGATTRPDEIDRLLAVVPRVWARAAGRAAAC
ncbi:MAG TPA: cysteine desulfurase family protein [Thermoanaerobaculia bacterium]|nr:cysteine desulfurase family protein [Thermoanaerobaculia bacterium]